MTGNRGTKSAPLNAMEIVIRPASDGDRKPILQIFNHYAINSFAAYPEGPLPERLFDLLRDDSISFVVAELKGLVIGFGLLKPFMPFPVFHATATASYFVEPGYIGKRVGGRILKYLEVRAGEAGITTLVVHISSKNEASIRFHLRNGFTEAGRLRAVGQKFGEPFDVVWMQKTLS
jgi:L-amino acid N-acyltransferase YncA